MNVFRGFAVTLFTFFSAIFHRQFLFRQFSLLNFRYFGLHGLFEEVENCLMVDSIEICFIFYELFTCVNLDRLSNFDVLKSKTGDS